MDDASQKYLHKRKPFRLLSKMDRDEIQRFRQFLEEPVIHGKPDKKLIAFFDHCLAIDLWHRDIDKPRFEQLTDLRLTDNAFDKLVSRLYAELTSFAGLVEFLASPAEQAPFWLRYYEKKSFEHSEIGKKVKEGKRELNNHTQNESYFRMMLELELESAEHSHSRARTPEERGISSLHGYLDSYFSILKLRFLCGSANEQRIYGDAIVEAEDDLIVQWFRNGYEKLPDLAKIYFHAFHVLKGIDDELHVAEFKKQLEKWEPLAGPKEVEMISELYGYLINYYSGRLNAGELSALSEVHHFYTSALHKGWILENGKITPEDFKNLLTTFCRMQLVLEGRLFFEQFNDRLTDTHGGASLEYNEALLDFYEKKYPKVIRRLESLIESKGSIKADQYYGLDFRCLLLKSYYEFLFEADFQQWDEIDEKLIGLLHAFPAYIVRKNLPFIKQIRFDNFRKSIHRLHSIVYGTAVEEQVPKMKELLKEFKSSSNLPDKGWFIQKANAFLESASPA